MYWLAFITVILILLLPYFVARQRKIQKLLRAFPNPPSLPIIGNLHQFASPTKTLSLILQINEKIGPNVSIFLFNKQYIIITEPKLSEFLLSSNKLIDKADEYKYFIEWFGLGLLTSTGRQWRSHRKILTPSFHYKILEEFVKVFDKQSFVLVDKLKQHVGKNSFDIFKPLSLFTLDVICETAMGTQVQAQENPDSPFVSSVRELCGILYKRCFSILRYNWIYRFSGTFRQEKRVVKVIRDFSEGVIRKRKQVLEESAEKGEGEEEEKGVGLKKKYTFLDVLLKSSIDGKPIPDSDIREEVDTFMFEGHDTTSIAISFTLHLLSKHKDIQNSVYEEIQSVYGTNKAAPSSIDKLQQLKYLEMVVKESLRLYPPVVAFARIVSEDMTFEGTHLPKGLALVMLPYVLHRNREVFPDPEKFDPERFSLDNCAKRHPYAYVPFSAGPRNCIGQKFAMLELKCTLAKILRYYEVLPAIPAHEVLPMVKVTLESATGIKIRLRERV